MPVNGDPTSDHPGYFIEIARAVFEPAGIKVDYGIVPWNDALKAVEAGEIDGIIGAGEREAAGLVVPREPIGEPRMCLFTRIANPWKLLNSASLGGRRIGCIEGYSYWDFVDAYIKAHPEQVTVLTGDNPVPDGIRRLLDGQIDVLPEALPVFAWNAKLLGHPLGRFNVAFTQPGEPIFVAFSRKTPEAKRYAEIFDDGMRRLRDSGKLKAILARYGLEDWR